MNSVIKRIPFLLLAMVVFTACSKEDNATQLAGVWRFEEVTFRKNLSLHKSDHTDVYQNIRLHFFNDHTFLFAHSGRKVDLTGIWEMDEEAQSNGETTTSFTYLDWWAEDHRGNKEEAKWDNITLQKGRLSATESKNGGTYKYRLVKEY